MSVINISEQLKTEIKNLANLADKSIYTEPRCFKTAIQYVMDKFSRKINSIHQAVQKHGYCLISNLPIDSTMITPIHSEDKLTKTTFISELSLLTIGYKFGNIITYQEENNSFIHNVFPASDNATIKSSLGSDSELGMHTEIAFSEDRPDYLMLYCLKTSQNKVPTLICNMDNITKLISEQSLKSLLEDDFFVCQPASFKGETLYKKLNPIKELATGSYKFAFNLNDGMMIPTTARGKIALTEITEYSNRKKKPIQIDEGSILIIDNNRMMHGRGSINANFDGHDRWLQRIYVKKNLNNKCKKHD